MNQPEPDRMSPGGFSFRGLITYLVALSFLLMLISGVVNFVAPSGRISRELGWTLLGIDRVAWQSLHLSFAVIFIVAGIVHIAFNWRGLRHYLRDRPNHHLTMRWHAVLALLITAWLGASAVLSLPPVSYLHDGVVYFRQAFWLQSPPAQPPAATAPAAQKNPRPLPAAGGSVLPPRHPPVPSEKACSDCHRR